MKCPRCGEDGPAPLTKRGCCYECASGHAAELHHVWGRANSPAVVKIPGNWHRVLDAMRGERCAVLRCPGADPLHRCAAIAATIGEAVAAFANYARREAWPAWVAGMADRFADTSDILAHYLLMLAGKLGECLGGDWFDRLGLPPLELLT